MNINPFGSGIFRAVPMERGLLIAYGSTAVQCNCIGGHFARELAAAINSLVAERDALLDIVQEASEGHHHAFKSAKAYLEGRR